MVTSLKVTVTFLLKDSGLEHPDFRGGRRDRKAAANNTELLRVQRKRRGPAPVEDEHCHSLRRGETIVQVGEAIGYFSLLIEGFACRAKHTHDGARQIMEFQIPGDFVDLHSYSLERLEHDIVATVPCRIVKLQHADITRLIELNVRFARIFWFATMVDASIHREWLVNLGARSGAARVAHLFCEMFYRFRAVGMTDGTAFPFPVSQHQLGEALGFTPVHTNRMLRELRERELATFRGKAVTIPNLEGLEKVAGFDPSYLYLKRHAE